MIEISVSTNATEVSAFMQRLFRDQLPFALSLAINETAKDFQKEQREAMKRRFKIRRAFVLQGVKINRGDFATKRKLEARVHIEERRQFLVKFERGGKKRPRGSRIAIPDQVKRTGTGVVSRSFRPRALQFRFHGSGPNARVFKGQKRTFLILRPGGRGAILQRVGRRGRGQLRQLFSFAPEAQIDPRLRFKDTATRVVTRRFEINYARAFDRAIKTAR